VIRLAYNIFKVAGDGQRIWVEFSPTLDDALARVQALEQSFPGTYIVRSYETGDQEVAIVNKTEQTAP
jgi:hypothetical protein